MRLKRTSLRAILLLGLLMTMSSASYAGGIKWQYSFSSGLRAGESSGRPVMLYFYSVRCGSCKFLDKDTWSNGKVIQLSEGFVCVKINAPVDRKTSGKFGIRGYPTVVFLDAKGKELSRIKGYKPPSSFAPRMEAILNKMGINIYAQTLLKKGEKHFKNKRYGKALSAYRKVMERHPDSKYSKVAKGKVKKIESRAEKYLASANSHYSREAYLSAWEGYERVRQIFPGTEYAREAGKKIAAMEADGRVQGEIKAERYLREAERHYRKKDYNQSLLGYRRIVDEYPKSKSNEEAKAKIEEIEKIVWEQLEVANNYFLTKDYLSALKHYKRFLRRYPASRYAPEAKLRIEEIEANEEMQQQIKKAEEQEKARTSLQMGDNFYAAGNYNEAMNYYQKIVNEYPQSLYAEQAQKRIKEIRAKE